MWSNSWFYSILCGWLVCSTSFLPAAFIVVNGQPQFTVGPEYLQSGPGSDLISPLPCTTGSVLVSITDMELTQQWKLYVTVNYVDLPVTARLEARFQDLSGTGNVPYDWINLSSNPTLVFSGTGTPLAPLQMDLRLANLKLASINQQNFSPRVTFNLVY